MPRGGARIGAGRKPKTATAEAAPKRAAKAFAPEGKKTPDAPSSWPFGTAVVDVGPEAQVEKAEPLTALALFQKVYRDESEDMRTRLGAAAQALPFETARPAPTGKKEARNEAARKTGSRFAPSAPPKLVAAAGRKV